MGREVKHVGSGLAGNEPGEFEDELARHKRRPKGDGLGRPSIMGYRAEGEVGAFQVNEYKGLITKAVTKEVKEHIRKELAEGRTLDEVLGDL